MSLGICSKNGMIVSDESCQKCLKEGCFWIKINLKDKILAEDINNKMLELIEIQNHGRKN